MIYILVIWILMLSSLVQGYQLLEETSYLQLSEKLADMMVTAYQTQNVKTYKTLSGKVTLFYRKM